MRRKGYRDNIVQGIFYPDSPEEINKLLERCNPQGDANFALFPHGDWDLILPVLKGGWPRLISNPKLILLISAVHLESDSGIFYSEHREYRTPLGPIPIDRRILKELHLCSPLFTLNKIPHEEEHSLEILFPLIRRTFPGVPLIPLLLGNLGDEQMKEAAEGLKNWATCRNDLLVLVTSNRLERNEGGAEVLKLLNLAGLTAEEKETWESVEEVFQGKHYEYRSWGGRYGR